MNTFPPNSIKVIGVGNAWRGDDAAGLLVTRRLRQENLPQVEIAESPGNGHAISEAWENKARVIVVDAIVSGGPVGEIYRFDAHEIGATLPVSHSPTTHGWGLSEALALGKVFQNLPPVLIIYGIEGKNFALGDDLTPAVAAAIPEAARRVTQEIQALLEGQAPEEPPGQATDPDASNHS
ncbi:MAG: hydrogenase maturation protease [Deltaproteobacteria bacterium]|jgi:hydrogenase maturation protease